MVVDQNFPRVKKYFLFFIFYFALTSNSYAYLDPGTGSIILSAIIAAIATTTTYFKNLWLSVKKFYKKKFQNKEDK